MYSHLLDGGDAVAGRVVDVEVLEAAGTEAALTAQRTLHLHDGSALHRRQHDVQGSDVTEALTRHAVSV